MTAVLRGVDADRALHRLRALARPAPPLGELGDDLLGTSRTRLILAVGRPLAVAGLYAVAWSSGHWIVALSVVPLVFLVNVCVLHDLMHQSLGLSRRANRVLLSALGLVILDSGHALQATHLEHHRRFPSAADPEAYLAGWPIWRILVEGPSYRYRLWAWAWSTRPERRRRLCAEYAAHAVLVATAVVCAVVGAAPAVSAYVATSVVGAWTFPLISVAAVHDARASSELRRSRTLRGRVVPKVMFGMGYHLEHHLWPNIPAHHLPAAARRVTRLLDQHRAAVTRVP